MACSIEDKSHLGIVAAVSFGHTAKKHYAEVSVSVVAAMILGYSLLRMCRQLVYYLYVKVAVVGAAISRAVCLGCLRFYTVKFGTRLLLCRALGMPSKL